MLLKEGENMADIIILSILGLCVFFIIRSFVKKAKNKELGCGCGCNGCSGCSGCYSSSQSVNVNIEN